MVEAGIRTHRREATGFDTRLSGTILNALRQPRRGEGQDARSKFAGSEFSRDFPRSGKQARRARPMDGPSNPTLNHHRPTNSNSPSLQTIRKSGLIPARKTIFAIYGKKLF
jgi:hypothetical protein